MRVCLWDGLWLALAYGMPINQVRWQHPLNTLFIFYYKHVCCLSVLLLRFSLTQKRTPYKTQPP